MIILTYYQEVPQKKITLSCSELYDVDLCDTDYSLDIINNSDGTVCILNSSHDKILSCNNQVAVWDDFNDLFGTFEDKQKWYFEKNNYLVGDSNADGKLDSDDITFIQQCISSYDIIPNNIQLFLSDANRDNIVNVRDVTRISMMINNKYLF